MAKNKKNNGAGVKLVAAIAIGIVIAGNKNHVHVNLHTPATLTSIGAGSLSTRAGWAQALLAGDGLPQTTCNTSAVLAWEVAEGGGFGNQAQNNPLNVNPGPGAGWPGYNAIGAWAFPDAATGLRYTVQTLNNGNYGNVLAAFRAGSNAQAVCDAIMASPWAASHYNGNLSASC